MRTWIWLTETAIRNGSVDLAREFYASARAHGDVGETFDEMVDRVDNEPTLEMRFDVVVEAS